MTRRSPTGVFAAVLLGSVAAFAWWNLSHGLIDRAAVLLLPKDMPRFFRASSETLAQYSRDPDLIRNEALPALTSAERPGHFLGLELLAGHELPQTRNEFVLLCRELDLDPAAVGMLPYSIVEWHDRLAMAFAEHRRKPRDRPIQAKILYIAGILSHYTADAAQPLHCTIHFDGRMNDDGTSPKSGIHAKMDALPAASGLSAREVAAGIRVTPVDDVFGRAVGFIRTSNALVDKVYELEPLLPEADENKHLKIDPKVRSLALECSRRAAELTAAAWYSAWRRSETIVLPEWYE